MADFELLGDHADILGEDFSFLLDSPGINHDSSWQNASSTHDLLGHNAGQGLSLDNSFLASTEAPTPMQNATEITPVPGEMTPVTYGLRQLTMGNEFSPLASPALETTQAGGGAGSMMRPTQHPPSLLSFMGMPADRERQLLNHGIDPNVMGAMHAQSQEHDHIQAQIQAHANFLQQNQNQNKQNQQQHVRKSSSSTHQIARQHSASNNQAVHQSPFVTGQSILGTTPGGGFGAQSAPVSVANTPLISPMLGPATFMGLMQTEQLVAQQSLLQQQLNQLQQKQQELHMQQLQQQEQLDKQTSNAELMPPSAAGSAAVGAASGKKKSGGGGRRKSISGGNNNNNQNPNSQQAQQQTMLTPSLGPMQVGGGGSIPGSAMSIASFSSMPKPCPYPMPERRSTLGAGGMTGTPIGTPMAFVPMPSPMMQPSPLLTPAMGLGPGISPRLPPDLFMLPPATPMLSASSAELKPDIRPNIQGMTPVALETKSNYQAMLEGKGGELGFSSDLVKMVEDRKNTHKYSEKKRRDDLKNGFFELMAMVPTLGPADSSKAQQYSKAHIIRKTIDYMQHLRREKDTLMQELERLKNENRQITNSSASPTQPPPAWAASGKPRRGSTKNAPAQDGK